MSIFFGIDIGGTNTKAGIFDRNGDITAFVENPTPQSGGIEAIMALIGELFDFFELSPKDITAIGIGVPGPVDRNGVVYNPPNLHGWGEIDFKTLIANFLKYPTGKIAIGNDANYAGLAEYYFGNGARADPMVLLTLGTGIGGAVILNGEPMTGKDGFAAELGHIIIAPDGPRCGCGRKGCAEAFISHTGIVKTAWDILKKDKGSLLWGMIGGKFDELTPKVILEAANLGDPAAYKIINITARYLGMFLADLINIFNPERIVIGGGISQMGKQMFEPAKKIAQKQALKYLARSATIVRAKFYQKAGMIGAAVAAMKIAGLNANM